ncbi:hypothetical protein Tcan_06654 [Toxocara canis]|uniref:Uncharacterized protein n=1 Tax=Toxocara canis TaxID=6265 RepID=A0A0B2V6W7_TOXCA|nr:hypothetical protein Tcan_06654 [Toxocara canis]
MIRSCALTPSTPNVTSTPKTATPSVITPDEETKQRYPTLPYRHPPRLFQRCQWGIPLCRLFAMATSSLPNAPHETMSKNL